MTFEKAARNGIDFGRWFRALWLLSLHQKPAANTGIRPDRQGGRAADWTRIGLDVAGLAGGEPMSRTTLSNRLCSPAFGNSQVASRIQPVRKPVSKSTSQARDKPTSTPLLGPAIYRRGQLAFGLIDSEIHVIIQNSQQTEPGGSGGNIRR